jgi:F-type H+-transporting ATPase subunit delta
MNSGAITNRYARALLLYTQERGSAGRVCGQVRRILRDPSSPPSALDPDLVHFVQLVVEKGRRDHLRSILRAFVDMYTESMGLKNVRLTTAYPVAGLEDRIKSDIEKRTGCPVVIETDVDPALIGGFRVVVNGMMLDASVRHQIELLKRQFIEKNNRLV